MLTFRSVRYGLLTIVPLVTGMMLNFLLMAWPASRWT